MPNHVTNGLTIISDNKKKLADFKEKALTKSDDGTVGFDFNAVIKQPDNIETENCSGKHENGVICWYNWNIKNWGTKWGAYDVEVLKNTDDELSLQFNTAWGPPEPVFYKLEEMFTNVSMTSINEDDNIEPDYFGNDNKFYVNRTLNFYDY